jgi:DNA mismatch repair ATPase MutS
MTIIHNHFKEIKIYLNKTLTTMENYQSYSNKLVSHKDFNNNLTLKMQLLTHINKKLCSLSEYSLNNISKFKEIGHILKYFYELHTDKEYEDALMYSFGFNGYIDCIEGLQNNIKEKKINFAIFIKENKKTVFKKSYYASLSNNEINCKPIKNTIKLKKNMIITGPNASGKTTILKSTLINIIFTQQFGCGFYDSAKLAPYNHIHCYLNIPDTSGRDSLFQAEARRCKEILDVVSAYKKESHFCVFDELYSGTNPEEAEICATAFMSYLTNYNNVSCLLTTHFINVCKNLKNEKNIMNFHMSSEKINHILKYHYILKQGITEVKGGINILTEMNYPEEIINKTINY